eukprot:m.195823 g.195823  ORF g.195823 m.195823 type:complete len:516 (+) comp39521_c1_seq2:37-1584(+)
MAAFMLHLLLLLWSVACSAKATPPHIIMIVADDLGFDDVSFHGSQQFPTPAIDALAREGVMLNNYYVQPICTPTRSSLMTARYPIHTGMQHNVIMGPAPYGLGLDEKLLPQYLKQLGYSTHAVGKWHLGFFEVEYTPLHRGFDTYFGLYTGKEDYFSHIDDEGKGYVGLDLRNGAELATNYTNHYNTELFTSKAVDIITAHNSSTPLFLYLAHTAVHSANPSDPLQAPQHLVDRFQNIKDPSRRIFAAMATSLDESVANVTDALNRTGLWNDSIVIFTTDNGGPDQVDRNVACNWPLKGGKYTLWEGGVRGAACINSPLIEKPNRVSMDMMHVTDWLPTLVHVAGGNATKMAPDGKTLDGVNMWNSISEGVASPRTEILLNIDGKTAGLRVSDYKLVVGQSNSSWNPPASETEPQAASARSHSGPGVVICGQRPVNATECNAVKSPCLFNIHLDPCEYNNLANEMSDKVDEMMERLHQYNMTAVPPRNKPYDEMSNPKLHGGAWTPWMNKTNSSN